MSRIESVKGVKSMYSFLQGEAGLVAYASKSEDFRKVVKNESELIKLYESILLNGADSGILNTILNNITASSEEEREKLTREFYRELRGDIETITKKSHMIRTNECPKTKIYYNGKTVKEMMTKFSQFMSRPDFYSKLSEENKLALQSFLRIETPKIDLADEKAEQKIEQYYENEIRKIAESELLPFIEKVSTDDNFREYLDLSSRLANKQIRKENLPTYLQESNKEMSAGEVKSLYDIVEFASSFSVKNAYEPDKIKRELCVRDSHLINSADKSKELSILDIKTIFLNAEKFHKLDMKLTPVNVEGEEFAVPSDNKLAKADLTYDQSIMAIKNGLEEIQSGGKYESLDPNIVKYVKFLVVNCPTAEFLPNIGLADATSCRLSKTNDVNKSYEQEGEVRKYLVDGPRFTEENIKDMLESISENEEMKKILTDLNGNITIRNSIIARVMNMEIDEGFLTEEELICKYFIEEYYHGLKDEEKAKHITSKEEYVEGNNLMLSRDDLKILFQCFVANSKNNPQFKMFNISEKDFEMENGRPNRMLERFNCSYDEFFEQLYQKYVDSYEQKAIFTTGDDPYTPFLRYIMGYCKDITYAPAIGMTTAQNSTEHIYKSEENDDWETNYISLTNSREYTNIVLSLPSARNAIAVTLPEFTKLDYKMQQHIGVLKKQKELLKNKSQNIELKIKEIKAKAEEEDRKLNAEEIRSCNYLMEKVREITHQIGLIDEELAKLGESIEEMMEQIQEENEAQEQAQAQAQNTVQSQNPMGMMPGMMPGMMGGMMGVPGVPMRDGYPFYGGGYMKGMIGNKTMKGMFDNPLGPDMRTLIANNNNLINTPLMGYGMNNANKNTLVSGQTNAPISTLPAKQKTRKPVVTDDYELEEIDDKDEELEEITEEEEKYVLDEELEAEIDFKNKSSKFSNEKINQLMNGYELEEIPVDKKKKLKLKQTVEEESEENAFVMQYTPKNN